MDNVQNIGGRRPKTPKNNRMREWWRIQNSIKGGNLSSRHRRVSNAIVISTAMRNIQLKRVATMKQFNVLKKMGTLYLTSCFERNKLMNTLQEKYGQDNKRWPVDGKQKLTERASSTQAIREEISEYGNTIHTEIGNRFVDELDSVTYTLVKMMNAAEENEEDNG